ncbi:MAG: endonuclease/exonuclease/phosphatase family protein [Hahellaceae bacterium]|nr:endonuclease/exonuclease/phosphatase family protein [Hahellaceae bacterium]
MFKKIKEKIRSTLLSEGLPGTVRGASSGDDLAEEFEPQRHIRLLTFNIQVGISTSAYRHYLTRSWQHVLPHSGRTSNLDKIGHLLKRYDVVALQEADGGSLRSGFVNQVQYLAESGGFPYWYQQLNRNLGKIAQHSNGLLSRYRPIGVEDYRLPGLIPGRGAIVAKYGVEHDPLVLVMMHLSLSAKAQSNQLSYIRDLIDGYQHVVLMGDMNNHAEQLLSNTPLKNSGLIPLPDSACTFPSWRPEKSLDHILVSPSLQVKRAGVVEFPVSDHLPIAMDIALPEGYLSHY